jgi:histidinol-phosphate phosphatase family protein
MKAVIIAGGRGERLKPLTDKIPKPMIKVGGIPVLEHQIKLLKRYGIKDIIILTAYLSEKIEKYFKDGKNFGVIIKYVKSPEELGNADRVKLVEDQLDSDFIVFYGDMMLDICLPDFINFHKKNKGICTLLLRSSDHIEDCDLIEIDKENRVTSFFLKPRPKNQYVRNLDNACSYIMNPGALKYIKNGEKSNFTKDVFPKLINAEKVYGYVTSEYVKDMGTHERLRQVRKDFKSGITKNLNHEKKQKAVFLDRDGTIVEHVHHLHKIEDLALIEGSAKAIKKINNAGFLAIVITNQSVVARGLCSEEELLKINNKMETLLGEKGARLDAIYYCPHHPDYTGKCNCRKPKIGMVKSAQRDFNIDLKKSYFVGDTNADIMCGINAGLKTIGVKTGQGCENCEKKPSHIFDDLNKAVDFIIK